MKVFSHYLRRLSVLRIQRYVWHSTVEDTVWQRQQAMAGYCKKTCKCEARRSGNYWPEQNSFGTFFAVDLSASMVDAGSWYNHGRNNCL